MQREQLNEASVGMAFAGQSRESITRTRTRTSTIEEGETLQPTALVRDEEYPKHSLSSRHSTLGSILKPLRRGSQTALDRLLALLVNSAIAERIQLAPVSLPRHAETFSLLRD